MNIIKTEIEGVLIIEPRLFRDARGYFFESFSERQFEEKVTPILGHSVHFCQDNESMSSYGYGQVWILILCNEFWNLEPKGCIIIKDETLGIDWKSTEHVKINTNEEGMYYVSMVWKFRNKSRVL